MKIGDGRPIKALMVPHTRYELFHVLVLTTDWLPDPHCCHVGGQNLL